MDELIKHVGIFEEDSYRIAKERFGDSALISEVESQFCSTLSNNPHYGDAVPYTRELFVFRTQAFYPRVPAFRVLYRYAPAIDPNNVTLLSIELAEDSPYDNSI